LKKAVNEVDHERWSTMTDSALISGLIPDPKLEQGLVSVSG
jgi:hypothetical protein